MEATHKVPIRGLKQALLEVEYEKRLNPISTGGVVRCPKCGNNLKWQQTQSGALVGTCETKGCLNWVQ